MIIENKDTTADISELLADLNDQQIEAVTSDLCNMLIFAGAGSGKTRVLVSRIIYLMLVMNVYPSSIFAVTFTNKAANVMRERIYSYANNLNLSSMWIGTFHGLCNKFLRFHHQAAGLPADFTILDPTDQLNIVKRIIKEHIYEEINIKPKDFVYYIDRQKELGLRPIPDSEIGSDWNFNQRLNNKVYRMYEEICRVSGCVDFTELILRTINVLETNENIRFAVNNGFCEILVDEFQDTNNLQMRFLKLLKGENAHVTVVGDDDQSIYSWRGANLENILNFKNMFPPVKIIKLEQNYRSTKNILNAANSVIDKNANRYGKVLWTSCEQGDPIKVYRAVDASDEAKYVVNKIQSLKSVNGDLYSDYAILYRNNFLSLNFETSLRSQDIPYTIVGGHKFYDRQEIKDVIGYMRMLVNPNDDQAFVRVVNVPPRKIGNKTLTVLYQLANEQGLSMFGAAEYACNKHLVSQSAIKGLMGFSMTLSDIRDSIKCLPLDESLKVIITKTGLDEYYKEVEKKERDVGHSKSANMEELVNNSSTFVFDDEAVHFGKDAVAKYLQNISLASDNDEGKESSNDNVKLMTIHGAKGLEFKNVFIVGFEEGILPSIKDSINNSERQLEEERRLCYVAITRAMKRCFITYAKSRQVYGSYSNTIVSQFMNDIDKTSIEMIGWNDRFGSNSINRGNTLGTQFKNIIQLPSNIQKYNVGMRVKHAKFGEGVILKISGFSKDMKAYINFDDYGEKCLLLSFCNLEIL